MMTDAPLAARCLLLGLLCLLLGGSIRGLAITGDEPQATNKFAVIINGVSGDPFYSKRFTEWAETMRDLLRQQLDFTENQIFYLTATPGESLKSNATKATADAVRSTFERLKRLARADSQVFVFLVGHGSYDGKLAKFNLVGPDLAAEDFGRLLDDLPTPNVILVNTTSASGPFVTALSRPGRIIITATRSGHERNATRFAEFFVEAFKNNQADADKNARVSLLEAFSYTTQKVEQWYKQQNQLATEHALLDDNGDKVGHGAATEGDGALARTMYLDSKPLTRAAGDPELQKLLAEQEKLERSIELLKARKSEMAEAAYEMELEKLLLQLAQLNQKIKTRQK